MLENSETKVQSNRHSPGQSLKYQSPFEDFVRSDKEGDLHRLLFALVNMTELSNKIKELNEGITQIGSSSAIESSRSKELLEEFNSLAEDIQIIVERLETATLDLIRRTHDLFLVIFETIGVQLSERARDVIDKIDRNLFERNCDCQAWAIFPDNIRCLTSDQKEDQDRACELLKHLCDIYEVYCDIFVFNHKGEVVASGINKHISGINQSSQLWFKNAMCGEAYVTDMYYCKLVKHHVVSYNCSIKDDQGNIIGVLSTRFNWDFVNEMLDNATVEMDNEIQVISKDGTILSAKNRAGILQTNISWLKAAQIAMSTFDGFSSENNQNGEPAIFGSARTNGYNEYQGKEWSVVITQPIHIQQPVRFAKTLVSDKKKASNFQEDNHEADGIHSDIAISQLRSCCALVEDATSNINKINFDIFLMSFNAATKSVRAGEEGRAFSVLADQIRKLSAKSKSITENINQNLNELTGCVQTIQQLKIKDAAWDCIDKVDRNLFERNCDVQAWTIFESLIQCAETGDGQAACARLNNLYQIYEVYSDIYLVDHQGKTVATAVNNSLIGNSFVEEEWFQESIKGSVYVTDMFYCEEASSYSVAFSAPVKNNSGQIVGVLTTRFNWDYIYDIIDRTIVPKGSSVYLVNKDGLLIASTHRDGILKKSFNETKAFRKALTGDRGVIIETDPNTHQTYYVGYAQTEGYNRYTGKGWICLAYQPIDKET